jgi:alkaline phosphatase D
MLRKSLALTALAAVSLLAQGSGGTNTPAQQQKPYVILVSVDGMRAEYLKRLDLPNFEQLWTHGVRSEGMIPSFPSKTFPNHYAIITGLYPGHHGIVGNTIWDPAKNATYRMSDSLAVTDASWYRGEPLWATAEKQGMVAASFFWPGSEAAIAGVRPSIYKKYDGRVPDFARVDTVLAWLRLPPEKRPHMITLYFSEVDHAGHTQGPLSVAVDEAAHNVDQAIGRLLDGIGTLEQREKVILVVVADHGMSEISKRWFAALDTIIDTVGVRLVDAAANANIFVRGGKERATVLRDSINRRMRHGRAYLNGEIPEHLHYNGDPRIGDLMVVMDDHFTVGYSNRTPRDSATHGWDPRVSPMMAATFIAAGPGIPKNKVIPPFENVELYEWMCELLGLKPAPSDGHAGKLKKLIEQ